MKNLKTTRIYKILFISIVIILLNPLNEIKAQCGYGAIQAERDMWAAGWNGERAFILWQYKAFKMKRGDWRWWGYYDCYNINRPFAKAVNASYLVVNCLPDENMQWHGRDDYRRVAWAWSSVFHDQIHIEPSTSRSWLGLATWKTWREDETKLGCLVFDPFNSNGNPTTRAGVMIHEGWHHWEYKRGIKNGHIDGPFLACTAKKCDYYYWHSVREYRFGDMHKDWHSPYQAQVEFLCDISECSYNFVPTSVRNMARFLANNLLNSVFINTVGYRCGDPRPW